MVRAELPGQDAGTVHVTVVFSPAASDVSEVQLSFSSGATVGDALRMSGLARQHPEEALDALPCGVWGRPCGREAVLRDGDRVELYRPLQVDPKEARRRRHATQRAAVSRAG